MSHANKNHYLMLVDEGVMRGECCDKMTHNVQLRSHRMRAKIITLVAIIFGIAMFRLFPHPPNVSPVAAMALFGGAYFVDKRMAFIVPFLALLISDLIIGLHSTMIFVYAGVALTVFIGMKIQSNIRPVTVAFSAVGASVLFFLLTNFGTWAVGGLYPISINGLMQAYVAGIPFFQNSLLGNLVFIAAMFGGFSLLQNRFFAARQAE